MLRKLHLLGKSEDGTATIELAIVASTLAFLLIGVVDLTMGFNRKLEMEQALQRSLEKIMNTTMNTTPTMTIKNEVSAALPSVAPADVIVDYLLECDGEIREQSEEAETSTEPAEDEEEPDASAGCDSEEVQRRYITATVTDEFEPFFPLSKLGLSGETLKLTAKAGMRVE
jgi:hypothetical protein